MATFAEKVANVAASWCPPRHHDKMDGFGFSRGGVDYGTPLPIASRAGILLPFASSKGLPVHRHCRSKATALLAAGADPAAASGSPAGGRTPRQPGFPARRGRNGCQFWCREGDLNPHGNPIRPSSVRVCQFRHPGTRRARFIIGRFKETEQDEVRRGCSRKFLYCRKNARYVDVITRRTAVTAVTRVKNVSRGRGPWNRRALPPIAPRPSPLGPWSKITPITKNASTKCKTSTAVFTPHLH